MPDAAPHPFATLTPDFVLDALASVGLVGDGRLMALNSYENRVYLAHLEPGTPLADTAQGAHPAVVLKFYRPGRWAPEQIEEEHAFAHELMAAEVPVVGPLLIDGRTLHEYEGFRFSVSPRRGGRTPELGDDETLEWIGRFLARLHAVGARRPFVHRPAVDVTSYGRKPRDWLLAHGALPLEVERAWADVCQEAIELIASSAWHTGAERQNDPQTPGIATLRLHADCHPGNILWTPADLPGGGPHFVDLDDCRSGPAVQDLWMLLPGERADVAGGVRGVALMTEHRRTRNEHRCDRAAVRVVAVRTVLRHRLVPVHERPALLGVAGVAGVVRAVAIDQLRPHRAVHVVTIGTAHLAFGHGMMRRAPDLHPLLLVADEAQSGLRRLDQRAVFVGVDAVARRAGHVGRCVLADRPQCAPGVAIVAAQADLAALGRGRAPFAAEHPVGWRALAAGPLEVRLARSVTGDAAGRARIGVKSLPRGRAGRPLAAASRR